MGILGELGESWEGGIWGGLGGGSLGVWEGCISGVGGEGGGSQETENGVFREILERFWGVGETGERVVGETAGGGGDLGSLGVVVRETGEGVAEECLGRLVGEKFGRRR